MMSDATGIQLDGITFIPSKAAAELTGYTQDYVGQLARAGLVDARRMGGLWFVSLESLRTYKQKAESYIPQPPQVSRQEPDSIISFDGKDFISAARASYITGYNQDYVGQLAREEEILAKQVGNRWYVERESIKNHKQQKDALLAAVQAQSVGVSRQVTPTVKKEEQKEDPLATTYTEDKRDLMPVLKFAKALHEGPDEEQAEARPVGATTVPIKIVRSQEVPSYMPMRINPVQKSLQIRKKSGFPVLLGSVAATIVIVLAVGVAIDRSGALYTQKSPIRGVASSMTASASSVLGRVGDILERLLTRELVYIRS